MSSTVYLTKSISSEGIMSLYKALGKEVSGRVAIKLHMGEKGNKNFLNPNLVKGITEHVNGVFIDANTLYKGKRATSADHINTAREHGFVYAPIDIIDTDGDIELKIVGGKRLSKAIVGRNYQNYDWIISIAHFKGHGLAGFGGSFKNMAVGMASPAGKAQLHGTDFSISGDHFLENVAEFTKGVIDDKGEKILYFNVMNNLSIDCDCDRNAAAPEMKDIGILASFDPVALDKACVDLVLNSCDPGKKHLVERITSLNAMHLLDYAVELGLGSKDYLIKDID